MPQIFYEIHLLPKNYKKKFRLFWTDCGLFLQENNEMFWLHILLVNALNKIGSSMHQILIDREGEDYHFQNNALFNILNLANQLHRSKFTYLEALSIRKLIFQKIKKSILLNKGKNTCFELLIAIKSPWKKIWHIKKTSKY